MKTKVITLFFMLVVAMTAFAADKVTEVFTLDHQMSSQCEKKIMSNLPYEKGVKDMKVDLKDNTITITYDPSKTDAEKLIGAFAKIGFKAFLVTDEEPVPAASQTPCYGSSCCNK